MTFRITQRSIGQSSLANLQTNLSRLGSLQNQLSSGKLITKPSDSPTGTVSAMQFRSEIRTNEQWARNAQDSLARLGTMDTTLTKSLESVIKARDLTLQGMNSGAISQETRNALAAEIDTLRESLLGTANTTYLGRPIFGGTTSGATAYDAAGNFVGNTTQITRTVGAGAAVRSEMNGAEVFGPPGADLFAALAQISTDLKAGNSPGLNSDLAALDVAMKNMQNKLAGVGALYNRADQMQKAAEDRVVTLSGSLSAVEDIDLPKTIVDLQMQQMAYEAALGATKRIIMPSLADFLR